MQWYEQLAQILLIGVANGALLALIALGYTLVYGIIELINFAHGDVSMIGTMLALTLVQGAAALAGVAVPSLMPGPLIVLVLAGGLVICMAACAALNAFIERVAYRPLRHAPRLAPLISAIGVSFILINVGLHWKGASQLEFPNLVPDIDVLQAMGVASGFHMSTKDLAVILLVIPMALGLHLFVHGTRLGRAMRATAQDREAAQMMGVDINTTIMLAFLLGGALAGAGGMMYGLYNNTAWFLQGFRTGLYAFTAAVMGGIGNTNGAMMGGLLIGVVAAFSDFLVDPRWTQAVVFGILILILVFRPTGILGEQTGERA